MPGAGVQPQQDPGVPSGWWLRRLGIDKREEKEAWSSLVYTESQQSSCVPRSHPERTEREKERKGKKEWHGDTKLQWARPITLFSKGTFIPWLVHRGNERCKVIQSQPKHYICFVFIKTRIFSAYLSHKQCCVHYLLALEACGHFMTLFW